MHRGNNYRTTNMTRHEEFLTDEFLRYAAECSRMAELAGPPKRNVPAMPVTSSLWAYWVSRMAAQYRRPQLTSLGSADQAAYA